MGIELDYPLATLVRGDTLFRDTGWPNPTQCTTCKIRI